MRKPLVIIESPYRGPGARLRSENMEYARSCLRDSLMRGEAPIASHLLYPQVLNDDVQEERDLGIECGLAWKHVCDLHVFYTDLGWSTGMLLAYIDQKAEGKPSELRSLYGEGCIRLPTEHLKPIESESTS